MRNWKSGLASSGSAFTRQTCLAALIALGLIATTPAQAQVQQSQAQQSPARQEGSITSTQAQAGATASGQVKPAPSTGAEPAAKAGEQPQAQNRVNDFTTLARVEYVFECLSDNPGPRHEMVYKCVCAIDRIAEQISYDRWIDLDTFFKARPMAGERGAYVRERADIQEQIKSYNQVQARAKKACFIPDAKK